MASARTLEAGKAVIKLSIDDRTADGMKRFLARADKIGARMKAVGAITAGVGGGIVAAFAKATETFVQAGSALDDMSKRTGFSTERLSELKFAAEQSGSSLEDVGNAAAGLAKFMLGAERGSAASIDALDRLGISLDTLRKLTPEERFNTLAAAISRIEDPTTRAALAAKVFGGAGRQLLPLFTEGASGMAALSEQARRLGLVMSQDDVKAASELGDKIDRLKAQLTALSVAVGSAVAEPLLNFAELCSDILATITKLTGTNPGFIKDIGGIGAAAVIAGGAVAGLGVALTAVAAHPVIAGIAAVTAGVVALAEALRHAEIAADALKWILVQTGQVDPGTIAAYEKVQRGLNFIKPPKGAAPVAAPADPAVGRPQGVVGAISAGVSAAATAVQAESLKFKDVFDRIQATLEEGQEQARELQRIQDEIARVRIDGMEEGLEKERARIQLERQIREQQMREAGMLNAQIQAALDTLAMEQLRAAAMQEVENVSVDTGNPGPILDARLVEMQFLGAGASDKLLEGILQVNKRQLWMMEHDEGRGIPVID